MQRIAVAVSGGADSLMSLLLLRETGAEILAVRARFLEHEDRGAIDELKMLCERLGISFHLIDLRQEFKRLVITPFVHAYQNGMTPNPCAACNPAIKFGLLLDRARQLGADSLATGHYARLQETPTGPALFRGSDPAKDQSYFLARVPRERFRNVIFPLSGWTKADVRVALAELGMIPPAGRESQEVCFIPDDYRIFLKEQNINLGPPGPIVLSDGTTVGRHEGLWNHTLGQRKGLGVAYSAPLYVIGKDATRNRLVVGVKTESLSAGCRTDMPNILYPGDVWPAEVLVQTVYRQRPLPARVDFCSEGLQIHFPEPWPLPAPGQVAVVYSREGQVLAGAVIQEGFPYAA